MCMKKVLFALLLLSSFAAKAQVFNNEWIDYAKPYYKFKIGKTGLFRISQATLAAAGIDNTPAEQFQLWRNGVQVPLFTSVGSGTMAASDYIEFWGLMNDGKPDKQLYRNPDYQLNDHWSLSTDSATYFLTINTTVANNLRLQNEANNITANNLPAEPYFMYTAGNYFKNKVNDGYAVNVGAYLYSSSYDKGEGWSSADIVTTASPSGNSYGTNSFTFENLYVYGGGPAALFKIAVSGNALVPRRYKVTINGDSVLGNQVDYFNYTRDQANFALSTIASNKATVTVTNLAAVECYPLPTGCLTDRMVVHQYELTYPRQFNFGGLSNFEFSLPAAPAGNYLEINNFSYGSATPVLYDLTNGKRYIAEVSGATLRFALKPSAVQRQLVLVSQAATNITGINSLQKRNFINYSSSSNRGNYLIISHPYLYAGANGSNPVEAYRAYRSSSAGGNYNAKIYDADELVDQFGFGIKKNPLAIRNFLRFARLTFPEKPGHVFIIGKGVTYLDQLRYESSANPAIKQSLDRLNLVPTFGYPASDVLLVAEPGSSQPEIPIGRLSVITPAEVNDYLQKVKEYELAQATLSPKTQDKDWMKNVVHIVGASDDQLGDLLALSMNRFKNIITDTLFGAHVSTFAKQSANAVEQLNNNDLVRLFNEGISLITYFGHSSASTLEFNLDNPENYSNQGKYPLFIGLGCNAGNFFGFNDNRFSTKETVSEKYVLAPNRGTIGFIASTHFGIVHYLDIWNTRMYKEMSVFSYGKTIGEIMKHTAEDVFSSQTENDFYARSNVEETELHGDPAIRMNTQPKPDYVLEDQMVKIMPGFISVADEKFKVEVEVENLGKAVNTNIVVEVKRQYPDESTEVIRRDTIEGVRYKSILSFDVPVDAVRDKGSNKITVTVDAENAVDELFETNNSITKEVMIYEDEARPVYPYNFAIINKAKDTLVASTANPFSPSKTYRMEMDTTELFNSPFKITKSITAPGGVLKFDPGVSFNDGTVYYWRVAPVPDTGAFVWNTASFIYLANSDLGFNQSHLYQHLKSNESSLILDSSSGNWSFASQTHNLFLKNTIFGYGGDQEGDLTVSVDGDPYIRSACVGRSLIFNVFDAKTFKPWLNVDEDGNSLHRFGSGSASCLAGRQNNFEFSYMSAAGRKLIMDFMDSIPAGAYVTVRSMDFDTPNSSSAVWRGDTAIFGSGKSLYHKLLQAGFTNIDDLGDSNSFAFIYQKEGNNISPVGVVSQGLYDKITISKDVYLTRNSGGTTSPRFGPAASWKQFIWSGKSLETPSTDLPRANILGIQYNGQVDTLFKAIGPELSSFDISGINSKTYPFLKIHMQNSDSANATPYQLNYWRLTYDPAPEGAVAPNEYFVMKDTVDVAEPLQFKIAFKNVSKTAFSDSIKVLAVVTDKNNVSHPLPAWKQRILSTSPDTLHVQYTIDTRQFVGANSIYVDINPDNDQPEQYHFNNFFYKEFYVRPDTLNPTMDVTFDNVHILNNDIVSANPDILIKLKDESKWFLMTDTATVDVQVRFPDYSVRKYYFDGTSLTYAPPQQAPSTDNTASINLRPAFDQDGTYELTVSGKDMSTNKAGNMQYRVNFQVYNKPMISNMLNYPNPFTTSTAFVFTITGSQVPQNIKIQILTVTGKVVREITKEELGPLHIGRNITDFKWDGTDQYGQKLGNGVYLYRVVTNLNGKALDKFTNESNDTDKYFNKGYGKMYLMR